MQTKPITRSDMFHIEGVTDLSAMRTQAIRRTGSESRVVVIHLHPNGECDNSDEMHERYANGERVR